MYKLNSLALLFIVIHISYSVKIEETTKYEYAKPNLEYENGQAYYTDDPTHPEQNNCIVIYIPEEKITNRNQDYNMILFKREAILGEVRSDDDGDTFDSQYIEYGNPPQKSKFPSDIGGSFIHFDNEPSGYRKIILDGYDLICESKYANKEAEVQNEYGNVIGYVYRNAKLNETNYMSITEEDLIRFAGEVVNEDGTRFGKRSNYLASCISGNNYEFAKMRCYALPEKQARKAYITKPYTLYSRNKNLDITVANNGIYWVHDDIRYFHPDIKPEEVSDEKYSTCYYKETDGNKFGRVFYIKDSEMFSFKADSDQNIRNYFKSKRKISEYPEDPSECTPNI